jgi:hypothetical protein
MRACTSRWIALLFAFALCVAANAAPAASAASPALWQIKSGKAVVYLFGTIHVLKPGTQWITPAIDKAMTASDDLWLEVPDDVSDPAALLPQVQTLALDPAHPLSAKITKADLGRLDATLKSAGLPGEGPFEAVRPWFAALMVSMLPAMKQGYSATTGIDVSLRAKMTAAGKPVLGFETVGEQLHFLADLSPAEEVAFLHESLDEAAAEAPKKTSNIDTLETLWQNGDVDGAARVDAEFTATDPALSKALITDRNARWAKKLDERLHGEGTSFVAVGLAHLSGPGSLIEDLTKRGYTVTRIE